MIVKVSPEELFLRHQDATADIAKSLTWKFSSVGSKPFSEDIESEAKKGLWEACQRFKPDRQGLACKTNFWNVVLSNRSPSDIDPYETFWSYAKLRIHGSVRDFLRKEKIITRQTPNGEEAGSIILEDRFVSTENLLPDNAEVEDGASGKSYSKVLESRDRADLFTQQAIEVERLVEMLDVPVLDSSEKQMVMSIYMPPGMDIDELGMAMHKTKNEIRKALKAAMLKMLAYHAQPAVVSG